MRFLLPLMLLLSVVVLVGCGDEVSIPETTTNSVTDTMKPILERVAETGDLEIANELKSYIEEDLAGVDQAKSDELMKDYKELMAQTDKAAIQAKAKEMLSKL